MGVLRKLYSFAQKSSNYQVINCHGLYAVAMQVVDIPGFIQKIIKVITFLSRLNTAPFPFMY